ncbi:hypothetical protein C2C40_08215 [Escherichia coli]|nr:hypothetical protein [Escherichia coli]
MRHSACSFFGEALTYHLLGRRLGPRLNKNVFRGLSTSGLQVFPPAISRKAPARILAWFFPLFQSVETYQPSDVKFLTADIIQSRI